MKEFIQHDTIRDSALKLVYKIYKEDHFIPDVLYVPVRGGVYMGNVISEFYKLVCDKEKHKSVLYAAVAARSRHALIPGEQAQVYIDGWTCDPKTLGKDTKVLLVDDIFDTGNTINKIASCIVSAGVAKENLKIAVYDYKIPVYKGEPQHEFTPDYWCRRQILTCAEQETWIHYLCHELVGLKKDEIDNQYKDEEVRKILHELC